MTEGGTYFLQALKDVDVSHKQADQTEDPPRILKRMFFDIGLWCDFSMQMQLQEL